MRPVLLALLLAPIALAQAPTPAADGDALVCPMVEVPPELIEGLAALQAAVPSPADSALVDRFVEALRLDEAASQYAAAADSSAARFAREIAGLPEGEVSEDELAAASVLDVSAGALADPARLADAIRQAVYEDLRPALLHEAVSALESPAVQDVLDRLPAVPGIVDPEKMGVLIPPAAMESGASVLLQPSSARDSAIAAFATATIDASTPDRLIRLSETLSLKLMPPAVAEATGAAEAYGSASEDPELNEAARQFLGLYAITAYGHLLRDADVADVHAATAWYTSEAGTYAIQAAALGIVRLNAQRYADSMVRLFELMPPEEFGPPPTDADG